MGLPDISGNLNSLSEYFKTFLFPFITTVKDCVGGGGVQLIRKCYFRFNNNFSFLNRLLNGLTIEIRIE